MSLSRLKHALRNRKRQETNWGCGHGYWHHETDKSVSKIIDHTPCGVSFPCRLCLTDRLFHEVCMSDSASLVASRIHDRGRAGSPVDFIIAAVFVCIFGVVVHAFQYRGALGESDLYRVLVGLLDGAVSGRGIDSPLHYDRNFGFGYLAAFYALADPATLRDPDRLMGLMNQVGFWSMIPAQLCFWCAVSLIHGTRAGSIALIVFALGPMIPELATSGHQVIPMFGFLCAAAILMFLPVNGWR